MSSSSSSYMKKSLENNKRVDSTSETLSPEQKKMLDAVNQLNPQPLSTTHLLIYSGGRDYKQENFINYHRESVAFGLNFVNNLQHSPEDALNLINIIAERRAKFAKLQQHVQAEEFGNLRKEKRVTPIAGDYDRYALSIKIPTDEEEVEYSLEDSNPSINIVVEGYLCTQKTVQHWVHEKPPADCLVKAAEMFFDLCQETFPDKETAAKKFAAFHWRMANWMPWERGSASIIDTLVDILWIKHFQWAPAKIAGNSLDCEALSEADEEKFIKNYLNYRPHPREIEFLTRLLNQPVSQDTEKEKYIYKYIKYSIHRDETILLESNEQGQTLYDVALSAGRTEVAEYLDRRTVSLREMIAIGLKS